MFKTLSVGELLWDVFPDYKKPGGSPANLAYHLHCFGNQSLFLSRVGDDSDGQELISFLQNKGISTHYIQKDKDLPTGTVSVIFDDYNEPSYTIHHPSSWDNISLDNVSNDAFKKLDAICFASLSQRDERSASTIQSIISMVPETCLKVFDLNLRPPYINRETILKNIHSSDVIKLNEDEYKIVGNWLGTDKTAEALLEQNPSKTILLTLGENGSAMFTSKGCIKHKGYPITGDGDFVGVGDAFLACFTHLLLKKVKPGQLLKLSNYYAAFVASQKGSMPDIPGEILEKIK